MDFDKPTTAQGYTLSEVCPVYDSLIGSVPGLGDVPGPDEADE